jgi:hypothetical protein
VNKCEPGQCERNHVDRARQQEENRRTLGDVANRAAPVDQQPGACRDAPRPAERHGGVECQLRQRHAGAEADWGALEHLEERQHVAKAGQQFERDRDPNPAAAHVGDGACHPVQPRDRQQQPCDERDEVREGDQPWRR